MAKDDLIAKAIEWAEAGIPVFPCGDNKAPLTENGFYDAESDPTKVKALFEFYGKSASLIGGRMGDGIFAVDVDLYKGDEVKQWMEEQIAAGNLPETRTHKTARGGYHFLYEGESNSCNPVNGVEVKGEGGYVILPGSPGYTTVREGITEAPDSLLSLIRKSISKAKSSTIGQLRENILSGKDFHNSLTQIAARLAYEGHNQVEIQQQLLELMENSIARNVGNDRHARWRNIMADSGHEFSRIVSTAYTKYSDAAIRDEMQDRASGDLSKLEEAAKKVFTEVPNFETPKGLTVENIEEVDDDEEPFKGRAYYAHEDRDIHDQKFSMYPIFAENETVVIFAEPKTGKTALSLTTALHIACGMDLGALKVTEAGACVYYALEGTRAIELRIRSWRKHMAEKGVELPDKIPVRVVERASKFTDDDLRLKHAKDLIHADRFYKKQGIPLKVIYIDTLTRAMSGKDQNSVEDTSALFEIVSLIREHGVTATVVFVHHKARTGTIRGSSNIEAEPDMLIDVSKKNSLIQAKIARARSVEDGATFTFAIENVDLGRTLQGHELSGMVVEPLGVGEITGRDVQEAQEIQAMKKAIIDIGKKIVDANEVLAVWVDLGLIKGRKLRGVDTPPELQSTTAQKALQSIVTSPGGAIFNNSLIREEKDGNTVIGFRVGTATF